MATPDTRMIHRRPTRRTLARLVGLSAAAGCVYGTYCVYRWAEPSPAALSSVFRPTAGSDVTLSMQQTTFVNFANGYKSWYVRADRIDVERPPGGLAQSSLQRAAITGIHEGKLYSLPAQNLPISTTAAEPISDETPSAPPAATFSAREGRYTAGMLEPVPNDLQLLYNMLWQFKLAGDVRLRTNEDVRIAAPALTILEMIHNRTRKYERRILCDEGVDITAKNVQIHANSMRYDPAARIVECTGGVRATMQDKNGANTVQGDSAFWSLKDQILRCPNTTTGLWHGEAFTARNLSVDTKRQDYQGSYLQLRLSHGIETIGVETPF